MKNLDMSMINARRNIVLLACGSFNPPHYLHARIFEVAKNHLAKIDKKVVHGWLSPVSDGYGKPGLGTGDLISIIIVS